jgi:two-component system, NtrC family, response regulator HydG
MSAIEVAVEGAEIEEQDSVNGFRVLVVDDDADFRDSLALLVAREGFTVAEAASIEEARAQLKEHPPDVMFVDLKLPDGSGDELLATEEGPHPDFVVISGNATIEAAVDALRQGALDFLTKPVDRGRLYAILAHVVRTRELRSKVSNLRSELRHLGRFGPMVGRSPAMQRIYELITKVAPTRASILITGESGTGKELVSETVHQMSPRSEGPFLAVNCGAVAPNVIESELFGHERGSFTGADRGRKGYFEEADGGTLLLDEITEMSADLQVKLLRVIATGKLIRVGASEPITVDVRVIAATNRDPEKAIRQGRLREDLYYRLNVFQIDVPPLRERGDDILMLAEHFLNEFNARESVSKRWSERALRRLQNYNWPGNVRELRNVVERAALLSGDVIEDPGLPEGALEPAAAPGNGSSLVVRVGSPLAEVERTMILATLRQVRGDKREAARRLGISLKTLYNRLSVYQAAGQMEVADRPHS